MQKDRIETMNKNRDAQLLLLLYVA